MLEPDDEADGQDAEQAEVEIAFAADFAFEVQMVADEYANRRVFGYDQEKDLL